MQSVHQAFESTLLERDNRAASWVMRSSPRLFGVLMVVCFILSTAGASRGQSWSLLAPTAPLPVPRDISAAVYSSASNRLILFGGYPHVTPYVNDLWILSDANGLSTPTWTQVIPNGAPGSPPARGGAVMVYDAQDNRAILVGGESAFPALTNLNDVWVLINADGTTGTPTWTQLNAQGGFPGREDAGAVYDVQSNRLIVFMGVHPGGLCRPTPCIVDPADVWVLTNANGLSGTPVWSQLSISGAPPGRSLGSVDSTYDPVNNRVMVFGGFRPAQQQVLNDVWVLTNANGLGNTPPTWTQLSPSSSMPAARSGNTAFYDVQTNRLVIFGGSNEGVGGPLTNFSDIWALDNANGLGGAPAWNQLNPTGLAITPHVGSSGLYDSARNRMILFGGSVNGFVANETWVLSNANGIVGSSLAVQNISPSHGGNAGSVTMQIVGSGFQNGVTVRMTGSGPEIVGANTTVQNLSVITTTFDLRGASPGPRDVAVTNPDSTSVTLASGFTVEQGGAPDVWVDILGRSRIRIGTEQSFYLAYGNRGNVDLYDSVLLVSVPKTFSMTVGNLLPSLQPATPVTDIGTEFLAPIWVYALPSGSTGVVVLNVTAPSTTTGDLNISAALLTSPTSVFASTGDFAFIPPGLDALAESIVTVLHGPKPIASLTQMAGATTIANLSAQADVCPEELLYTDAQAWQDCENRYQQSTINNIKNVQNLLNPGHSAVGTSLGILGNLQPPIGPGASIFGAILDFFKLKEIGDVADGVFASRNAVLVSSFDPNDKVGSAGVGTRRFISGHSTTSYSIYFDNQPTATAPAQTVTITDTLDTNLDLTTVALGPISFANELVTPPSTPLSLAPFTTTIDLRPTSNLLLKINTSLNALTRVIAWTFQSLDPATGLPPTDPLAGFLPPGAEGSVFFNVMPKSTAATGTVVQNTATIVFDVNPPINTPTWSNTIDATPPTSQVSALPAFESSTVFIVQWTGTDVGSGIQDFTIYASDNGGPFGAFLANTTATSATFTGQTGHTYAFYSIARDRVGNVEGAKTVAEATTQVVTDTTPPVTTAVASTAPNGEGWNNSNVTITLNSTDNELGGTGVKQIQWSLAGAQTGSSTVPSNSATVTISTEGTTTLTYFGTDNAGNVETANTLTIRLDKTPPTITGMRTPRANANGWNNSPVTVSFQCSDSLSGLAAGSPPASTVLSGEGAGQSFSGTCTDVAGNSATSAVSGINIDKTPPMITVSANPPTLWPPKGKMVTVTISGTMADNLSGVNSSTAVFAVKDSYGLVQPGGPVGLAPNGAYSFVISLEARRDGQDQNGRLYTIAVSAQDNAGNASSATTTVIVPHDQGQN